MRIKIILLVLTLFISGCSNNLNEGTSSTQTPVHFYTDKNSLTLYESSDVKLFSIEYQFKNNTSSTLGPFYINFIFHDNTLIDCMKIKQKEYAPYQRMGGNEFIISLKPGEIHKGGVNIELLNVTSKPEVLQDIVEQKNSTEIQLLSLDTTEILANHWIRNFSYVSE